LLGDVFLFDLAVGRTYQFKLNVVKLIFRVYNDELGPPNILKESVKKRKIHE